MSANTALLDLGSSFLRRLGNQATNGFNKAMRSNPRGGGEKPTASRREPARSAISSAIAARRLAALPASACALRPASTWGCRSIRATPQSTCP
jgi:hypothetical protein